METVLRTCGGLHSRALVLAALAVAAPSLAQSTTQAAQDGSLILYDMETEIGTVGRREYHDEAGRLVKLILYAHAWPSTYSADGTATAPMRLSARGTIDPNSIAVCSIEAYDYDDRGRSVRTSRYGRGGALSGFTVYRYDHQGSMRVGIDFTPDGRKSSETRYSRPPRSAVNGGVTGPHPKRGPELSYLLFDDTGERLIAVRGALPDDLPWTWGWGQERNGLCCAIAPSSASGTLDEIRIAASVRNVTSDARAVALGQGCLRPVLHNGAGEIVPIGSRGRQYLLTPHIARLAIEPGKVSHSDCDSLGWWYPDLAPGRYSLEVEYLGDSTEWLLVSNTLTITIVDPNW